MIASLLAIAVLATYVALHGAPGQFAPYIVTAARLHAALTLRLGFSVFG